MGIKRERETDVDRRVREGEERESNAFERAIYTLSHPGSGVFHPRIKGLARGKDTISSRLPLPIIINITFVYFSLFR